MRLCCTATPADLINMFLSFMKCARRQTCGTLHLLRNKSFLHQPLNKFICWQIHHSKKKKKKKKKNGFWNDAIEVPAIWGMGTRQFCRSVTPTCPLWSTGHLDNTYDTDSDPCQGKCPYVPLSVEVYSSWFSFVPSLCMQACNQFLHGYLNAHFTYCSKHRKTNMCLLRGKRGGALWCVCVSCMFYREH